MTRRLRLGLFVALLLGDADGAITDYPDRPGEVMREHETALPPAVKG